MIIISSLIYTHDLILQYGKSGCVIDPLKWNEWFVVGLACMVRW